MIGHALKSLLYYFSIFVGVVSFSFMLFNVAPSDPGRIILGANASTEQVKVLDKKLGLDKPLYEQFFCYLEKALRLDFGYSYVDHRNIKEEILQRFRVTLMIILLSLFFTLIYLTYVLVLFVVNKSLLKIVSATDFLLSSMPIFFSGIIIALMVVYFYPVSSFSGKLFCLDDLLYLIPPSIVMSFYPASILSSILREELSKILNAQYIVFAKANGFSKSAIMFKFALRNALIPVLSGFSNILPIFVTGTFIVEIIFSIPAIGSLLVQSILNRDFPLIEGIVIINCLFFIATNLFFEILYVMIDPRIRAK